MPEAQSPSSRFDRCHRTMVNAAVIYPGVHLRVPLMRSSLAPLIWWSPQLKGRAIKVILSRFAGDFIDVGANIGQTLIDFVYSQSSERYFAFEPNRACARILEEIIVRNRLQRCTVLPTGLADIAGTYQLYLGTTTRLDTRATIHSDLRPARSAVATEVEMQVFDDICSIYGINEIGLIKVDVEGAELEVLRGMRNTLLTRKPVVICEVLRRDRIADSISYQSRVGELVSYLDELRYKIYPLRAVSGRDGRCEPLKSFPLEPWTRQHRSDNDYIFWPHDGDPDFSAGWKLPFIHRRLKTIRQHPAARIAARRRTAWAWAAPSDSIQAGTSAILIASGSPAVEVPRSWWPRTRRQRPGQLLQVR